MIELQGSDLMIEVRFRNGCWMMESYNITVEALECAIYHLGASGVVEGVAVLDRRDGNKRVWSGAELASIVSQLAAKFQPPPKPVEVEVKVKFEPSPALARLLGGAR